MKSNQIISILSSFVSEHKQRLIEEVLAKRTRHLTFVFEDIDKPHNVSAVLRTAEIMGLQDMHFIKNQNDYHVNPEITQGAAKWLTLHHHNEKQSTDNIDAAFSKLRSEGYQIFATSLGEGAMPVGDIDTSKKTAIVFGTEAIGITPHVAEHADGLVQIPMRGFTESFNLSVSAAIILTTLMKNYSPDWALSEEEKLELKAEWYRKIVREADKILARAN